MKKGFTQMRHFLKLTILIISGGRMVMLETAVSSFTFDNKCEGFGNFLLFNIGHIPPSQPHWASSHPSLQAELARPPSLMVDEQLSYSDLTH